MLCLCSGSEWGEPAVPNHHPKRLAFPRRSSSKSFTSSFSCCSYPTTAVAPTAPTVTATAWLRGSAQPHRAGQLPRP